ncbi:hypothetical protein HDA40_001950 [Hamadaea flava]|uniref:SbcC/MukB-like Walker B domain-containing protein n=1 Tax=Hamadaea flava TaxID=1742688 RepID=A0ABV8LZQ7_9ACTN|nr:SbcC/MukB-like Walker B domain-containing protein [Hamadaea flava]MCP2323443.1 hypothetical protein [Hamadaea flava]
MTTNDLTDDLLNGLPIPTRGRWQPLRAGICGLFHYDAQVFVFYRGRLLLRGNNGNGKSMALEVLLPYVLVADIDPSQLSTFGNRTRSMFTWLLGHDQAQRHSTARGYVWVEFGRIGPLGQPEYFTVGAGFDALRAKETVNAWYFTTSARVGVHLQLGSPGTETLTREALQSQLLQLSGEGLVGDIRSPRNHRAECNRVLFGLPDTSYSALLKALRQLRRPKLSDKLSQKALAEILRDSLPRLDKGLVTSIASGYERLDRHQADIKNCHEMITGLRDLDNAYSRYARAFLWQRATAITTCDKAISRATAKAQASASEREKLAATIEQLRQQIDGLASQARAAAGRLSGLRESDAYIQGRDLQPLREQADTLDELARRSRDAADDAAGQAQSAAELAEQARQAAELAAQTADDRHRLTRQGAELFTLLSRIYQQLAAAITDTEPSARPTEQLRHTLREAVDDLRNTLKDARRLASDAASAARAAEKSAGELESARGELIQADQAAADAGERLRHVRDQFIQEARTWMANSDQLLAASHEWRETEPTRVASAMLQWCQVAHRTRTSQLTMLIDQFSTGPTIQARHAGALNHQIYLELLSTAHSHINDAHAAASAYSDARTTWLQRLSDWAASLAQLPTSATPMPTLHDYEPQQWGTWTEAALARRLEHIDEAERRLRKQQRDHAVLSEQRRAEHEHLTTEREKVAAQATLAPPAPRTRLDSRHNRPGAPLYLLVDFVDPTTDPARLAGLEAALIGSGLADAWLHPDGLLRATDGTALADTQLAPIGEPAKAPLTKALRVDLDATRAAGLSADTVTAVLASVGLGGSAHHSQANLAVGWDGSWIAGPLHGAYRQQTSGLIGAASRERARTAHLAELDEQIAHVAQQLADDKRIDDQLTAQLEDLTAAAQQSRAEAASLPATLELDRAFDRVQSADRNRAEAVRAAESRRIELHASLVLLDDHHRDDLAALALADPIPGEHPAVDLVDDLESSPDPSELDRYADSAAAMLANIAAANQRALDALRDALASADSQLATFPDSTTLRQHEHDAEQAKQVQNATQKVFAGASERSQQANTLKKHTHEVLTAALAQVDLTAWSTRLDELEPKVNSWVGIAEDWLTALSEHHGAAERHRTALDRSAATAAAAVSQASIAKTDHDNAAAVRQRYNVLAERIGGEYTSTIAEIAELEQQCNDIEAARTRAQSDLLTATGQLGSAKTRSDSDEAARVQLVNELPHLAAALQSAFDADLPRAAKWEIAPSDAPANDAALGAAATPDLDMEVSLAEAVRVLDLAGTDTRELVRDLNADLASEVFELRHKAEVSVGGRLTLIERYITDILVVEADRDGTIASLPATIHTLQNEVVHLEALLNREEAKLLEQFLTEDIRRQVTGHIEAARKQIKSMGDLMQHHKTSAGYCFTLAWEAAAGAEVDDQAVDLLNADFDVAPSAKERLRAFFADRIKAIRATKTGQTWQDLLEDMLDYRRWYQFQLQYAKGGTDFETLDNSAFDKLSGGEKSVALHLPLFAAAATHTVSATVRDTMEPVRPGCPRLILLDEVFAGVDEDMRGELFDLVTSLDMDLVATSEAETGMYAELDGIAIYHLIKSQGIPGVLAARSIWTGSEAISLLDNDLELAQ